MTEFVAGIDGQPGRKSCDGGESDERHWTERLCRRIRGAGDQCYIMQRYGRAGQPAVVAVLLELAEDFLRGIVSIFADQPVDERGHYVIEDERQEKP